MSAQLPTAKPLHLLTLKEQRYLKARLSGDERTVALRKAGLPDWMRGRDLGEVEALVVEATQALAELRFSEALIDAHEIHEYLTDAIRARMSDIRNDDHTFKPRSEWPEIWDRMEEAGDVDVEYEKVRSHDGEDTEGLGGWETGSKVVVKVKLKFASRVKLLELAMKHRGVNAMVQPQQTTVVELHEHRDQVVNLAAVCTLEQLEELKRRAESPKLLPPAE